MLAFEADSRSTRPTVTANIAVHNPWHTPTDDMIHSERNRGICKSVSREKYMTRVSDGLKERWSSRNDRIVAAKVTMMFSTPDVVDNVVCREGACDRHAVKSTCKMKRTARKLL